MKNKHHITLTKCTFTGGRTLSDAEIRAIESLANAAKANAEAIASIAKSLHQTEINAPLLNFN